MSVVYNISCQYQYIEGKLFSFNYVCIFAPSFPDFLRTISAVLNQFQGNKDHMIF